MGLRTQIRRKRHGRRASRRAQWTLGSDENELLDLIQLLRPIDAGHELIRIGGRGDGGYLIPNDLEGIGACFSPGVGPTSQFEQELATRFGIKCFLADASIEDPSFSAAESPFFDFENKFIGCHNSENFIRLEDWITDKYGTIGGGGRSAVFPPMISYYKWILREMNSPLLSIRPAIFSAVFALWPSNFTICTCSLKRTGDVSFAVSLTRSLKISISSTFILTIPHSWSQQEGSIFRQSWKSRC